MVVRQPESSKSYAKLLKASFYFALSGLCVCTSPRMITSSWISLRLVIYKQSLLLLKESGCEKIFPSFLPVGFYKKKKKMQCDSTVRESIDSFLRVSRSTRVASCLFDPFFFDVKERRKKKMLFAHTPSLPEFFELHLTRVYMKLGE